MLADMWITGWNSNMEVDWIDKAEKEVVNFKEVVPFQGFLLKLPQGSQVYFRQCYKWEVRSPTPCLPPSDNVLITFWMVYIKRDISHTFTHLPKETFPKQEMHQWGEPLQEKSGFRGPFPSEWGGTGPARGTPGYRVCGMLLPALLVGAAIQGPHLQHPKVSDRFGGQTKIEAH